MLGVRLLLLWFEQGGKGEWLQAKNFNDDEKDY
jgi:hypothetical protein